MLLFVRSTDKRDRKKYRCYDCFGEPAKWIAFFLCGSKWQLQNYKLYYKTVCGCDEFHSFLMCHNVTYSYTADSICVTNCRLNALNFGLLLPNLSTAAPLFYLSQVRAQKASTMTSWATFFFLPLTAKKTLHKFQHWLFTCFSSKYTVVSAVTSKLSSW